MTINFLKFSRQEQNIKRTLWQILINVLTDGMQKKAHPLSAETEDHVAFQQQRKCNFATITAVSAILAEVINPTCLYMHQQMEMLL